MSGSPAVRAAVRPGVYHDSVVLMQLQRALAGLAGRARRRRGDGDARQPRAAGGERPATGERGGRGPARPADLREGGERGGGGGGPGAGGCPSPGTPCGRRAGFPAAQPGVGVEASCRRRGWVLVSVPGRWAAGVAHEALDLGRNVFLYSDNVSSGRRGGPQAEGVRAGAAGLGAGLRHGHPRRHRVRLRQPRRAPAVSGSSPPPARASRRSVSFLHDRGFGISQAIGTGGRDLSSDVGGITAEQALDLLGRDAETEVIVLISKPPAPEVTRRLIGLAHAVAKPVVVCFLGSPPPLLRVWNVCFAIGLEAAVEAAVSALDAKRPGPFEPPVRFAAGQRWVRGLFSGGTLALEILARLSAVTLPSCRTSRSPPISVSRTLCAVRAIRSSISAQTNLPSAGSIP